MDKCSVCPATLKGHEDEADGKCRFCAKVDPNPFRTKGLELKRFIMDSMNDRRGAIRATKEKNR